MAPTSGGVYGWGMPMLILLVLSRSESISLVDDHERSPRSDDPRESKCSTYVGKKPFHV